MPCSGLGEILSARAGVRLSGRDSTVILIRLVGSLLEQPLAVRGEVDDAISNPGCVFVVLADGKP